MYFLVIAAFDPPSEVAKRYMASDMMLPQGLETVNTWIDVDLKEGYLILKTLDLRLLRKWMAVWNDIVRFEVIRVFNGEQARNAMLRMRISDNGASNNDADDLTTRSGQRPLPDNAR